MSENIQELWIREIVFIMVVNEGSADIQDEQGEEDEATGKSSSVGQDEDNQGTLEEPEAPEELFNKIAEALGDDPECTKAQLRQCWKLANYLLSHKRAREYFISKRQLSYPTISASQKNSYGLLEI